MTMERRLLHHVGLQLLAFVTLSFAQQYYPQNQPQQYYYLQQQQQPQYYYQQQQQQQQYYPPQQQIIYQQQQPQQFIRQQPQQPLLLQQPQFQQQQQQQTFVAQQPQQQPQQQIVRAPEPKIIKSEEAFDIPPPPSRFLPDGSKFIQPRQNRNFRRGGQINNQQRRPSSPPRQPTAAVVSQPPPHKRVEVSHTRAPQTAPRAPQPTRPPPPPPTRAPAPPTTRPPRPSPTSSPTSHLSTTTKKSPNSYFLSCCKNKKVAKSCESRCNFDILSKKVLTGMFLGSDICPSKHGLDLFACAAQDGDHTPCCQAKNVQRTGAGEKCLNFCKMTPGSNFQADASYLPCWAVLNDIKSCFKEAIIDGHTL